MDLKALIVGQGITVIYDILKKLLIGLHSEGMDNQRALINDAIENSKRIFFSKYKGEYGDEFSSFLVRQSNIEIICNSLINYNKETLTINDLSPLGFEDSKDASPEAIGFFLDTLMNELYKDEKLVQYLTEKKHIFDDRSQHEEIIGILKRLEKNADRKHENNLFNITYNKLSDMSKQYYETLTNPDGRFYHMNISDIILTGVKAELINTFVKVEDSELPLKSCLKEFWSKDNKHVIIIGEGGMGKTVSLIRLWKFLTEKGENQSPVPLFISLNEYNNISDVEERSKFIINSIGHNYLCKEHLAKEEENTIWEIFNSPIITVDGYCPSVILLLDGFNEVTVNKNGLLNELERIVKRGKGTQVIITSRFDIRSLYGFNSINKIELLELSNIQIKDYLCKYKIEYPSGNLLNLLRNPMMLTLFAATCEIMNENISMNDFNFYEKIQTNGELLYNFVECQLVKVYSNYKSFDSRIYYKFIFKHIIPYIGYYMELHGKYILNDKEFFNVINDAYNLDFSTLTDTFPEYIGHRKDLGIYDISDECKDERFRRIVDIICSEFTIIVKEREKFSNLYRFIHQNFRDYFAATYILNQIRIGLETKQIACVLAERPLPNSLARLIGEMEGEYYNKPVLKNGKWLDGIIKETNLHRVIDFMRNIFNEESNYAIWNVIEIWKIVRGELSGLNLSNLNLVGINLNGVRLSRGSKSSVLSAKLNGSLIDHSDIFPQGHNESVTSAYYSEENNKIVSSSVSGVVKEWDIKTNKCISTINIAYENMRKVTLGNSNNEMYILPYDSYLGVYNRLTNETSKFEGHMDWIVNACANSQNKILTSSYDGTLIEWDIESKKSINTYSLGYCRVNSAFFNKDNSLILYSESNYIKEFDIESKKDINIFKDFDSEVTFAIYNKANNRILSASLNGMIKEWDVESNECIKTYFGHQGPVNFLTYNKEESKILSCSNDKTIKEWDIESGECIRTYIGYSNQINHLSFCRNYKKILLSSDDGYVKELDLELNCCINIYEVNSIIKSSQYFGDEQNIITLSEDNIVRVWSSKTGLCVKSYLNITEKLDKLFIGSNQKYGISIKGNCIKEWDLETNQCKNIYDEHNSNITCVEYSKAGERMFAACDDGMILEWDVKNLKITRYYENEESIKNIILLEEIGRLISISSSNTYKEWDINTGKSLNNRHFNYNIMCISYDYLVGKIAIALENNEIKELDIEKGNCISTCNITHSANEMYYINDLSIIFSTDRDIRILDKAANQERIIISNIPGLLLSGCDLSNLHPINKLTLEDKEILRQYGVTI